MGYAIIVLKSCRLCDKQDKGDEMKFHHPLDDLLGQKSKVRILRHLARTRAEWNGRQIAADIGMSPWVCHQALKELCAQGVVQMRNVGNTHLYRLAEQHYLVAEVLLPLFQEEREALQRAIEELTAGLDGSISSVILYGSVARGEEEPFSDVDLLVVIPNEGNREAMRDCLVSRGEVFASQFGNMPSHLILGADEFREKYRRQDPLIGEIVSTGRVIYGQTLSELLGTM